MVEVRERIAPIGSTRRSLARFVGKSLPRVLRGEARFADERLLAELRAGRAWTVDDWVDRQAERDGIADLADVSDPSVLSQTAHVFVAGDPSSAAWIRTLISIDVQTFPTWRAIEGGERPEAGDGFVVALRAGETLRPDALGALAQVFAADERIRAVTFDEVFADHHRVPAARVGPRWSPLSLCAENLWGSGVAWRAGEIDPAAFAADPSEELRKRAFGYREVAQIPAFLKHDSEWAPEQIVGSEDIVAALAEGPTGGADPDEPTDLVSIVIPSRFSTDLLEPLIAGLKTTNYPTFDLVIVDNSGRDADKIAWYEQQLAGLDAKVLWDDPEMPFNYSAANNRGAEATDSDVLVFLNDDIVLHEPNWLWALVTIARQPNVGVAGAHLTDGAGLLQHGGVTIGINGLAEHLFAGANLTSRTLLGSAGALREVSAVTGATMALDRSVFDELGGFDEHLALTGSDVDLCLRAAQRGTANVVIPGLGIDHLESVTRGAHGITDDVFLSWWKFLPTIMSGDPHFHPELSLVSHIPAPASPLSPHSVDLLSEHLRRPDLADLWGAEQRIFERCALMRPVAIAPPADTVITWVIPDSTFPDGGSAGETLRIAELVAARGGEHRVLVVGCDNQQWARSMVAHGAPGISNVTTASFSPMTFSRLSGPVVLARGLGNLVSGEGVLRLDNRPNIGFVGLDHLPLNNDGHRPTGPAVTLSSNVDRLKLAPTDALVDVLSPRLRLGLIGDSSWVTIVGEGIFEQRCAAEALLSAVGITMSDEVARALGVQDDLIAGNAETSAAARTTLAVELSDRRNAALASLESELEAFGDSVSSATGGTPIA